MATPSAPHDPERRTASLPPGPFTYTDAGRGPVLVAVHGLPGSVHDFRWLGAALGERVRLLRLDMPGFGGTPLASEPQASLEARGAFVAAALAALGVERCILLGHSMGGGVALAAAAGAPGRVAALALLASIGLRPHRLLRRFVGHRALARAVDRAILRRPVLAILRAGFRRAGFPPRTPDAELAHTLRCLAAVDFATQARNTARLAVPTLTAWAHDDALIESAVFEEHAAALPRGPRLSRATGGHNIQKSRAVELAEALAAFAFAEGAPKPPKKS